MMISIELVINQLTNYIAKFITVNLMVDKFKLIIVNLLVFIVRLIIGKLLIVVEAKVIVFSLIGMD